MKKANYGNIIGGAIKPSQPPCSAVLVSEEPSQKNVDYTEIDHDRSTDYTQQSTD
jgi:hypothetical protein